MEATVWVGVVSLASVRSMGRWVRCGMQWIGYWLMGNGIGSLLDGCFG